MITTNPYLPVIPCFTRFGNRWAEDYKYPVDSREQLPVKARADAIRETTKRLIKIRPHANLWVDVTAPGKWYLQALKSALYKYSLPIAITQSGREPTLLDFRVPPITSSHKPPQPTFTTMFYDESLYGNQQRKMLRISRGLSRMLVARASEIASVSDISHTHALELLSKLAENGYVQPTTVSGKYPGWCITKDGISWVQKYWNVPPGMPFASKRREQRYSGQPHRHKSRMGRLWITKAYCGLFEIYEYWTEPDFDGIYPDGLGWGTYCGSESLVWMEVDRGGHSSKENEEIYYQRWQKIKVQSEIYDIPIIFILLAQRWVLNAAQRGISDIPSNMAVVFAEWGKSDSLPLPIFGKLNGTCGY